MTELRNIVWLVLGLLLFTGPNSYATIDRVDVQQFDKTSYKAASQNWCVSTTSSGVIYFANHKGLLEFDGSTWQLHELPNQTILRSVNVQNDTLIFTSGYMELGYWKRNHYGQLYYTSLNPEAEKYFSKNIEFWNIVSSGQAVYFHSFSGILSYKNDSITNVELSGLTSAMNTIQGKVIIAIKNKGLFEIADNVARPFLTNEFFNNKLIRFILPYKNNQILLGTESNGIYAWDGTAIKPWKDDWQEYFIENELNRGHYTNDGQLILGTIKDGIVVFDENENPEKKVNVSNGLLNNTILGIDTDSWGNIWLALDDGISFIPRQSNQSFGIESIPEIGAIYTTAILNNKTYFGTNQGLFVRDSLNKLAFIPGTQGQIWDCQVIDGKLWVGHNEGTFVIENDKARKISDVSGGFSIKKDDAKGTFIQSTYTNLVRYSLTDDGSVQHKNIDGFYDLVRYIEIDHLGNIWASHMHLGVYKIATDDEREKVNTVTYFGDKVFGQNHSTHVFKVENRIVFTTNKELFTYDDLKDTIVPFQELNRQLGKYASSHRIIEAPNHHYWFIAKNNIGLFEITNEKTSLIKEYPTSLFTNPPLVDEYENILPLSDKKAILCLQNGIATLDASQENVTSIMNKYKPSLRLLQIRNNRDKYTALPLTDANFELKNNQNNLLVKVSFPHISNLPLSYQILLEGLDTEWSEKRNDPQFMFERLPYGEYKLKIKTSDIWENDSQVLEIPFEVLAPWHLSAFAITSYFILLVLGLLGFRSWGIRQTRRKEQQQHEKREKELIRLRNEKLRNEIQHKSKELANSTMAIIKKNEFLLDLKNSVEKQKQELGSRYPDKYFNHLNKKIDDNISNQDDWQVFETNFERAHEQFFMKMRAAFPELTSNDLRLCAYLRMNLSSKEIAPLLGISVRGVENHRYRLRKKMDLQHDDSLTDTIHGI
jgi:DNA-binding CsgD family transcriptional regulator/ligand-binding sensor domain-containing protein